MTDPQWSPIPETDFDTCKCYCHIDAMLPGRPGGPCDSCRHAPPEPNAIALPVDIARFVSLPMVRVDVREEMSAFELRGVVLRGSWRTVVDAGVKAARGEARCFKNGVPVAYGADLVLEGEDVLRIEWSCELPPAAKVWVAFENTTSTPRDDRQAAVMAWVKETFGVAVMTPHERAMRFFEEAVELMQAAGVDRARVESLVDHVYGRAPGDVAQEAGGVGITLLAFCASVGLSADACEAAEFARALKIDKGTFQARHNAKADAGVALRVAVTNPTDQPIEVAVSAVGTMTEKEDGRRAFTMGAWSGAPMDGLGRPGK